jgi:hypothetical protein
MELPETPDPNPEMAGFRLRYRGEQHKIDADTLAVSLLSTNKVIVALNKRLGSGRELKVEVNAPRRGSFEVELTLTAGDVLNAFGNALTYTETILSTLIGILEYYRYQSTHDIEEVEETDGGKTFRAENGDQYRVEDDGVLLIVQGGQEEINESIARNFSALQADTNVQGFDVEPEVEGPSFTSDRSEFPELAEGPAQEEERDRVVETVVSVYQPSLDGSRKWGVNYDGNKIEAAVEDDGFLRRVSSRAISLANGDRLDVDLRIEQEWDKTSQDWVNMQYVIESVYDVQRVARQQDAFNDNGGTTD